MRLPRWLLVTLLTMSALAALAVAAWLWIAMPRRTAERFVAAIDAGNEDEAKSLLTNAECRIGSAAATFHWSAHHSDNSCSISTPASQMLSRDLRDIVFGHQRLEV